MDYIDLDGSFNPLSHLCSRVIMEFDSEMFGEECFNPPSHFCSRVMYNWCICYRSRGLVSIPFHISVVGSYKKPIKEKTDIEVSIPYHISVVGSYIETRVKVKIENGFNPLSHLCSRVIHLIKITPRLLMKFQSPITSL